MKIHLNRLVSLLVLTVGIGTSYAETPPWWNDGMGSQSARPNGDAQAQQVQKSGAASGAPAIGAPVLEEYPITVKPAQSLDERARENAAAIPAAPAPAPGASSESDATARYSVQAGDLLLVSVWHEPDLTREVRVSPDGWITFPLVGDVVAEGETLESLRASLEGKLHRFITEAVVDVSVKEPAGNRIYVVGKVNRPGAYPFSKNIDVVQALSLAGGTSKFAANNDIKILRRVDGAQQTYKFRYSDVERGQSLEQNIMLRSGDVVVVP